MQHDNSQHKHVKATELSSNNTLKHVKAQNSQATKPSNHQATNPLTATKTTLKQLYISINSLVLQLSSNKTFQTPKIQNPLTATKAILKRLYMSINSLLFQLLSNKTLQATKGNSYRNYMQIDQTIRINNQYQCASNTCIILWAEVSQAT